jgi:hypothetical protein
MPFYSMLAAQCTMLFVDGHRGRRVAKAHLRRAHHLSLERSARFALPLSSLDQRFFCAHRTCGPAPTAMPCFRAP